MTAPFERVDNLADVNARRPTYLALGVFDGVHRGHQHLLRTMAAGAARDGARSAVVTFFPHPRVIIEGVEGRLYLMTLEHRVASLAAQGIDLVVVHPFTEETRNTRAADFVDRLRVHLDLRQIWGGHFSLGYQREGDADYLRKLGQTKGFRVHEVPELVQWNGSYVSSSRIRRGLAIGNMAEVNGCLGRPFSVSGKILKGDQRGRIIGFPTANLDVWEQQLLPANGVYATYAYLGEKRFVAATNVGVRPTVADPQLAVEAHLLDFDDDIYGQELRLEFLARLRDEQKFPSLDVLKKQIEKDVAQVRQLL